jgi:hypothetical protein
MSDSVVCQQEDVNPIPTMSFASALATAIMIFWAALPGDDLPDIAPRTALSFSSVEKCLTTFAFRPAVMKSRHFVPIGREGAVSIKTRVIGKPEKSS